MTYEMMRTLCWLTLVSTAISVLIFIIMNTPLWPRNWGRLSFGIFAGCSLVNFLISAALALVWSYGPHLGFALVWLVSTVCFGILTIFWKKWATMPD